MKILTLSQIQAADAFTIKNEPIASIDLMERASTQLYNHIKKHYLDHEEFVIFAGSGNNGGDALALARLLFVGGFKNVSVFVTQISNYSLDCKTNLERLKKIEEIHLYFINENDVFPQFENYAVIIDGIFGSGLNRPVLGYWGELIHYINNHSSEIVSIDIPSGLFGENNADNKGAIIQANITLTFQFPKLSFFFAENYSFVGEWQVLDIGLHQDFIDDAETEWNFLQKDVLSSALHSRKKFAHKGNFGHAFLIAGSYQMMGAAVLASKACMRSGVGLLTTHVPQSGYEIMQTAVPEAMLCIDETELIYCDTNKLQKYSSIGIGPGIGKKKSMQHAFLRVLENTQKSMVVDADALNILSENKEWIAMLPDNSILTPHPGEFDRLTKKHHSAYERLLTQQQFSKEHNIIVVLKGAYTSVSNADGKVWFNSTGNPGMATAGSGDVLTGIILSLLAQGYMAIDSAKLGVFIHGLAGDYAEKEKGQEALIASDIINNLGVAFKELKEH
ncbi:MAG: NAD(P)H-hydrate dehydratase [Salinivirgaceae bacterium]|nr:NAD(P)H-hydrate dehydratase [Salinivirgaceae bacterium]